jgi:hypothetical protein
MGLKRVGEVQMHRPFEDDPLFAPLTADTEDEFEEWVEKHKEPVMQKLSLDNYFNVWVSEERGWDNELLPYKIANCTTFMQAFDSCKAWTFY